MAQTENWPTCRRWNSITQSFWFSGAKILIRVFTTTKKAKERLMGARKTGIVAWQWAFHIDKPRLLYPPSNIDGPHFSRNMVMRHIDSVLVIISYRIWASSKLRLKRRLAESSTQSHDRALRRRLALRPIFASCSRQRIPCEREYGYTPVAPSYGFYTIIMALQRSGGLSTLSRWYRGS